MDLSELRDLLDYLENQGVDPQTVRQVFERYCPKANEEAAGSPRLATPREGEEVLAEKTKALSLSTTAGGHSRRRRRLVIVACSDHERDGNRRGQPRVEQPGVLGDPLIGGTALAANDGFRRPD